MEDHSGGIFAFFWSPIPETRKNIYPVKKFRDKVPSDILKLVPYFCIILFFEVFQKQVFYR